MAGGCWRSGNRGVHAQALRDRATAVGRGSLMLYLLSIHCIGGAVALWLFADKKTIDARSSLPMPADDAVHNHLVALQREYPQVLSLALPIAPLEYDGWIEEMLKRARMRRWGLTREQEATLIGQLTALQDRKLAYVDTTRKLSQAQRDLQRDHERAADSRQHEDEIDRKSTRLN